MSAALDGPRTIIRGGLRLLNRAKLTGYSTSNVYDWLSLSIQIPNYLLIYLESSIDLSQEESHSSILIVALDELFDVKKERRIQNEKDASIDDADPLSDPLSDPLEDKITPQSNTNIKKKKRKGRGLGLSNSMVTGNDGTV